MYEKSWYAITESCLAMSMFREEFDVYFVSMFTFLLFVKMFHWLTQDRVDYVIFQFIHFLPPLLENLFFHHIKKKKK